MRKFGPVRIILEDVQRNSVCSNRTETMQIRTIVMSIIIVMEVSIQFNIVHVV